MNNTEKGNVAVELKHSGYNCCQAVLCAFKDECGLDEALLKHRSARPTVPAWDVWKAPAAHYALPKFCWDCGNMKAIRF